MQLVWAYNVLCLLASASAGISSGLTGVSIISRSVFREMSSTFVAANFTKWRISVLGMPAFTPYMLMWSPLYVAQPRASSERSPVPMTSPFVLLAKFFHGPGCFRMSRREVKCLGLCL